MQPYSAHEPHQRPDPLAPPTSRAEQDEQVFGPPLASNRFVLEDVLPPRTQTIIVAFQKALLQVRGHSAPRHSSQLTGYLTGINAYNILTVINPDDPFPDRLEHRPSYEPEYQLTSAWIGLDNLAPLAQALVHLGRIDDSLLFTDGHNMEPWPLAQLTRKDLEQNLGNYGVSIYQPDPSDSTSSFTVHYEPPDIVVDERALVMPIPDCPLACINREHAAYLHAHHIKEWVLEPHTKTADGQVKALPIARPSSTPPASPSQTSHISPTRSWRNPFHRRDNHGGGPQSPRT